MTEIRAKLRPTPPKMLDVTIKDLPEGTTKQDILRFGEMFTRDGMMVYVIELKDGTTLNLNPGSVVYDYFDEPTVEEPVWVEIV